ncbi:replication protein [Bacillus sp. ISL-7]|uniref:replication protein n=1 Tax=Bacillus sp. ISL-7 TaxID=2819136 RepID=UPI001BE62645|nr:replication protein [Bacillus sp. ISL-7]MBT2735326.1 replication protein [Bacillus sp. ISL-7]
MANVQIENGYTKIANELFEELAKIKLSPTQYRLLFVIWRYTYGFNRKEHEMSLTFLSQATGCDLRQIQRELKSLEVRKLIFQKIKSGNTRKITFNKNHDDWVSKSVGEINNGERDISTLGKNIKGTNGEIDKQEINKKILKENVNRSEKPNPYLEYEKLFGTPSPMIIENFRYWIENSQFQEPEAIICETIRRAKLQSPKNPTAYVESILKNLHNLELYTLGAVKIYNANFDARTKSKKSGTAPTLSNMFVKTKGSNKPLSDKEKMEIKVLEEEFPF